MKKRYLVGISFTLAILFCIMHGETYNTNAVELNSKSINTEQVASEKPVNNNLGKIKDFNSVSIDYGQTDSNGNIADVVNNRFGFQSRRLLTTIKITAPYAYVWKYTSNGRMVKTGKALAYGTKWAAYVDSSTAFWQVGGNEFIHKSDAIWVGP